VKLLIVIASTRPGRVGLPVGRWFESQARAHAGFEVEVADLAELNLPFLDEPKHPRLREYTKQHTKEWSATVDGADAFAFVMPEYNHGLTAPLKNAIDFLSYGGVAAGTRAAQMLKPVLLVLRMTPVSAAVSIPFVAQHIGDDGELDANEVMEQSAQDLLDELVSMSGALSVLRSA